MKDTSRIRPDDENPAGLKIVVPSVEGREHWLESCLVSIRNQHADTQASILVSGNGTGERTEAIAQNFNAEFVHRPKRLSSDIHIRKILTEIETCYLWILADDDLMAPGALDLVTTSIENANKESPCLKALIGRVQNFSKQDTTDLRPPRPPSDMWIPGEFSNLTEIAKATKGNAFLGTFIFRTDILNSSDYDRYEGTSHGIFGAFWDGLNRTKKPRTLVLNQVLAYARQDEKAWDDSVIRTHLGLYEYFTRLPTAVSDEHLKPERHFTRQRALRYSTICTREDRPFLDELVATYKTFSFGSRYIASLPKPISRLLLWLTEMISKIRDRLYLFLVKTCRLRRR